MEVSVEGSGDAGQLDLDRQSVRFASLGAYRPSVTLDDLAHDRKSEPRAAAVPRSRSAIETLEHVRQLLRRQPAAVVAHREPVAMRAVRAARDAQLDRPAFGNVAQRVDEQVVEHLLDPPAVGLDPGL